MRTAICISGQPRKVNFAVSSILLNLVIPNGADVFLHAWFNSDDVGKHWDSAQPDLNSANGRVLKDTDKILMSLNPKAHVIEPQIDFTELTKGFKAAPTADQPRLASNFYSVYSSNMLKRRYEVQNGFVYDCVVRCRYDLVYDRPIVVEDYSEAIKAGKLVVPKNYQEDQDAIPWNASYKGIVDIFAIADSKTMDKYAETFLRMGTINNAVSIPFGEVYAGVNSRIYNNIELSYADIKLDLARRTIYRDSD